VSQGVDAMSTAEATNKAESASWWKKLLHGSKDAGKAVPKPTAMDDPVSLYELAKCYNLVAPSPSSCPAHDSTFFTNLQAFARQQSDGSRHGPTPHAKTFFFCSSLPAGVVLLASPEDKLHLTFPPLAVSPPWVTELLVTAEMLYIDIREYVYKRHRSVCLDIVFDTIVQLLRLMGDKDYQAKYGTLITNTNGKSESRPAEPNRNQTVEEATRWAELQRIYTGQLSLATDLVQGLAQRHAQIRYLFGMIIGVGLLAAAVGLLNQFPLSWVQSRLPEDLRPLQWLVPLVGGTGAVVSVMQRMASDTCILRYRVGATFLTLLGMFRPVIGSILCTLIVLLIASRVVPVQMDVAGIDSTRQMVLFVIIAFLSGFSERLAQDMLGVGTAQLIANKGGSARAVSA
jgi:hypothetical protein